MSVTTIYMRGIHSSLYAGTGGRLPTLWGRAGKWTVGANVPPTEAAGLSVNAGEPSERAKERMGGSEPRAEGFKVTLRREDAVSLPRFARLLPVSILLLLVVFALIALST